MLQQQVLLLGSRRGFLREVFGRVPGAVLIDYQEMLLLGEGILVREQLLLRGGGLLEEEEMVGVAGGGDEQMGTGIFRSDQKQVMVRVGGVRMFLKEMVCGAGRGLGEQMGVC